MQRRAPLLALCLLAAGSSLSAPAAPADAKPTLSIYFETQLPYVYEGDGLKVAITVKNISDGPVENSKGVDLIGGLLVEDARGSKLKPAEKAPILLTQPARIDADAFFGRVVEITDYFPAVGKPGNYRLTWTGEGAVSNQLILHVVQRFDAKKGHRVRIETDFGPIVIDLYRDSAPRHVQNFVDLIRQGFYNGNQFHRVIPGQAIIGGSPTGELTAGSGYNLKPELSRYPIEAGTVVQVRNRETGADDSGSHIMITAITKPDLRGRVSVLGKVVEGLDTVKTICQVPTVREQGTRAGAPGRPVQQVLMRKVTVTEFDPENPPKAGDRKEEKKAAAKKGS
jgi:peptidyl-prolyl cis-trans isomerase B (cyclophilin B)